MVAIVLFAGLAQLSAAQESNAGGKFKFGIKGGVNFSNLNTQNVESNNVLTGFNAGLFAKIPITESLAIQPEFLYTTKGAKLTYNNYFVNGSSEFNLNYLEAPVLLVINLTPSFNIHAGPYLAYLLDGNVTEDVPGTLFNIQNNITNSDYNRFDTGLAFGLGYDAKQFGFGARYNYGLQKVGKERNFMGTNYTFPDGKNSVINLYLSYSFL
ncbi:MAG: PorT family protein [Flavobacterium sp.]|nr:PorT family protein [Flavobacterium sp.]